MDDKAMLSELGGVGVVAVKLVRYDTDQHDLATLERSSRENTFTLADRRSNFQPAVGCRHLFENYAVHCHALSKRD
ncbi:MAG: hypothetical protein ACR2GH_21550 [Pseudonocardia sp.]